MERTAVATIGGIWTNLYPQVSDSASILILQLPSLSGGMGQGVDNILRRGSFIAPAECIRDSETLSSEITGSASTFAKQLESACKTPRCSSWMDDPSRKATATTCQRERRHLHLSTEQPAQNCAGSHHGLMMLRIDWANRYLSTVAAKFCCIIHA